LRFSGERQAGVVVCASGECAFGSLVVLERAALCGIQVVTRARCRTGLRNDGKDMVLKLFVGLGNPGAKYADNRHNVGFMAVDAIAQASGFDGWRSKFQGVMSTGRLGAEKVVLLKPETFMNLSGQSVGEALRFFKIETEDVVVFHDEIDLAPAKIRVKRGGGHAGHNGLRSLHQHIGPDYVRVRIGVGHPGHKDAVSHYVLHDFSREDRAWLTPLLDGICDGAAHLAGGDNSKFLNAIGLRMTPGDPAPRKKSAKPHKPEPAEIAEPEDTRSLLQRLADRFS